MVCDGVGGSIKRQAMGYCIRSPAEKKILFPLEMYNYAVKEVKTIKLVTLFEIFHDCSYIFVKYSTK